MRAKRIAQVAVLFALSIYLRRGAGCIDFQLGEHHVEQECHRFPTGYEVDSEHFGIKRSPLLQVSLGITLVQAQVLVWHRLGINRAQTGERERKPTSADSRKP